jgi:hypothetical protein
MDPVTLLILGGAAAGKATMGYFQQKRANRLANQNSLNNQPVLAEYQQNLEQAQRMAREGLPEESYRAQQAAIDRNAAFGTRQLQTGRGQMGNVANLVANTNRATQNLNAMDASARQANQSRVMSARDIIARAKQRSYEQNAQAIAALKGAGIQNVSGAFDLLGGGAMMGIDSDTFAGGAKKTTDTFNAYAPTREEVLQSRQYAPMSMQYNPIIRRKP